MKKILALILAITTVAFIGTGAALGGILDSPAFDFDDGFESRDGFYELVGNRDATVSDGAMHVTATCSDAETFFIGRQEQGQPNSPVSPWEQARIDFQDLQHGRWGLTTGAMVMEINPSNIRLKQQGGEWHQVPFDNTHRQGVSLVYGYDSQWVLVNEQEILATDFDLFGQPQHQFRLVACGNAAGAHLGGLFIEPLTAAPRGCAGNAYCEALEEEVHRLNAIIDVAMIALQERDR